MSHANDSGESLSPKCKRSRLVSELMSDHRATEVELASDCSKFFVRSNNEDFQARQSNVFDRLLALEEKHCCDVATWKDESVLQSSETEENEDDHFDHQTVPQTDEPHQTTSGADLATNSIKENNDDDTISSSRGNCGDTQFKIPTGLPLKRNAAGNSADFSVHPERWTKYSLSDVDDDCLSDSANTRAAFDFLSSVSDKWKACCDYSSVDDNVDEATLSADNPVSRRVTFKAAASCSDSVTLGSKTDVKTKLEHLLSPDTTTHDDDCGSGDQDDQNAVLSDSANVETEQVEGGFRPIRKRQRNLRKIAEVGSEETDIS